MMLRRFVTLAVFVAVLVLAPRMWASGVQVARLERETSSASLASLSLSDRPALSPRATVRKRPSSSLVFKPDYDARFIVKFKDSVKARTNVAHANQVVSRNGANLASFQAIVDQYNLTVTQHISRSEQDLEALQSRAVGRSGRAQPDLAGILRVSGPAAVIERAAREVNALEIVEFVEFTSEIDPDLRDAPTLAQQLARERIGGPENLNFWDGQPAPPEGADRKLARPAALASVHAQLNIDTGAIAVAGRGDHGGRVADEPEVVFSHVIDVPDVPWIRLYFRDVLLSGTAQRNNASYLVVTSLVTGESQELDASALHQWSYASAYFRGGSVLLQVFAYPGTGDNRVVIDRAEVGEWVGGFALSICDTDDTRVQSNDPAVGRITSAGGICTGFLFNDNESCMLSVSSCLNVITAGGATVHFNVPDSLPDGTPVPAAVVDQFPVLVDSVQFEPCPQCGSNWSLFGLGDNPAGQTPLQWQGSSHTLATEMPGEDDDDFDFEGMEVIVRGYGTTTNTNAPDSWSATQTEHVGEWLGVFGTLLAYRADTTAGTEGGPVIDAATGLVVGIDSCGGCLPFGGGANFAASILQPNIPHALANPNACAEDAQGPTGSCCVFGTCFNNILPSECAANGGFFNGLGTVCPTGPLYEGPFGFACFNTYLCCSGGVCSETTYWGCCPGCGDSSCGSILNVYGGDYVCDEDPDEPDPITPCEDEPACGEPTAGDCYTPRGTAFCNDEDLCTTVCEVDPFCCDPDANDPGRGTGRWDEICVWHARRLSFSDVHPCFASTGDCESPNSTPGCADAGCCLAVCMLSPACCGETYNWDAHCVELAQQVCALGSPDGPTPDFTRAQGYLTAEGYFEQFDTIPAGVAAGLAPWGPFLFDPDFNFAATEFAFDFRSTLSPILGWGGEGFDLDAFWEFGELIGGENLTRGKTIRIGVLYPTAFVDPFDESKTHEDLRGRVIYPEVDQTMIINPESPSGLLDGHVGTAVLGIIGANPDNGTGIRGMAPDADLYFFPTVSHEQGGRFQNAFTAALEIFEHGDVLVLPYTPRAIRQNFTTSAMSWTLLNLAADLGITCVAAAGDEDLEVDQQAGGADCQAIVVGAVTPGFPYFRQGWSNFCTDSPCDVIQSVHVSAWGSAVATIGYGDLFLGRTGGKDDLMRSYTNSFGGTAASSAQIAAVAAMSQGLAKQFWDVPLAPLQIRGEIALNAFCQAANCNIGGDGPPGRGGEILGFGDWDPGADSRRVGSIVYNHPQFPDGELIFHGVFPILGELAEWIVDEGYFDDCHIEEIYTVRGQHQSGITLSACRLDQNYYVARSVETGPNSGPSISIPEYNRELNRITYAATGQIADVLAVARPEWDVVTDLTVTAQGVISDGRASIAFIELYDWTTKTWNLGGVTFNGQGEPVEVTTFDFIGASQYVRSSDKTVLVRVWVYGLPIPGAFGDGSGDFPFDLRIDLIDIVIGGFIDKQD